MTSGRRKGQGRGEDSTSPRRITAAERQAKAVEMKLAGLTNPQIAAELGYAGRQGAAKAIEAALAKLMPIPVLDQARQIEWQRLEALHAAYWPRVLEGEPEAGRVVIRAMERRAKLLGLDALPSTNAVANDVVQGVLDALIGLAVRLLTDEQRPVFLAEVERSLLQITDGKDT